MKQAIGLVFVCCVALCQERKWDHEPTSFINIALDKPLSDSVQPCPTRTLGSMSFVDPSATDQPCSEQVIKGDKQILVHNEKGFSDVMVIQSDGKVGSVSAIVSAGSQAFYEESLRDRFGAPTSAENVTAERLSGAKIQQRTLVWRGENCSDHVPESGVRHRFGCDLYDNPRI